MPVMYFVTYSIRCLMCQLTMLPFDTHVLHSLMSTFIFFMFELRMQTLYLLDRGPSQILTIVFDVIEI